MSATSAFFAAHSWTETQVPTGDNEVSIHEEMPHLVGKCCYFIRSDTVDPKNGVTVKGVENDISRCAPPRQLPIAAASH